MTSPTFSRRTPMTTATLTAPTGPLLDQPTAPVGVDLQPLRPLDAIELAGLTLAIDELGRGSELTRYVRTRRWVLRRLARPATADRRAYVVRHDGRAVGLALLDNLRRGRVCTGELTVHVDAGAVGVPLLNTRRRGGVCPGELRAPVAAGLRGPARAGEGGGGAARGGVGAGEALGLHRLEAAVLPEDEPGLTCYATGGFTA